MKYTVVPGHLFYQGEDGKYYNCLREVEIELQTRKVLSEKEYWEEVDYADAVAHEEIIGRQLARAFIDGMRKMQREDPEKWAEIEARAEESRKSRKK